jgi:3-oxoacyl-[acyl-carrier-protein] synthase II
VTGRAQEPELARIDPSINPRRLDRSSRLLTAAAALCLGERKSALRGELRERAGLFLGACRMPHESASRCKESIRRGGAGGISASAFARMSVNAPAGACAMTLGLKGPSTTVSVGEGSGLLSIALAARWLATRDDADLIVAGALDELDPALDGAAEGALCALLEAEPAAAGASHGAQGLPRVVIAGTGLAGPSVVALAAQRALGEHPELDGCFADADDAALRACLAPRAPDLRHLPLGLVDVGRLWGRAEACRSALAFALAVERLRAGDGRALLVASVASGSASVALLVRRVEPA